MRKCLILIILLCSMSIVARGQSDPEIDLSGLPEATTAESLRYWFDTDASTVKTTTIPSGATSIDASVLKEGIHTVHYQIIDNQGIAGITDSKMFIKLNTRANAKANSLRYWFDTDASTIKTTTIPSGAISIDASALKEGIHTVHYQIIDNQGIAGITDSKMFIKLDTRVNAKANSLRYWFNTDASTVKTTTTLSGTTSVDASALKEGIHTVHYQIIDDQSIAGITDSKMFIKLDTRVNAKTNSLRYWFDTDASTVKTTTTLSGTTSIDVSALKEGIHTLHYQIVDDKNNVDIPVSALFVKLAQKAVSTPTKIRYWFNEDATSVKVTDLDLENLTMKIDASNLPKGTHELHMQLMTADGELTPTISSGSFVSIIIKKGDANSDGKVDAADIVEIKNYMTGNQSEKFDRTNADFNSDEIVNIADILGIVNIIVITAPE